METTITLSLMQFHRSNYQELKDFAEGSLSDLTIERRLNGKAYCILTNEESEQIINEGDYIAKTPYGKISVLNESSHSKLLELFGLNK